MSVTRAALVGLGVMSLGLACTEKGRSLVLVEVTVVGVTTPSVPIRVHVTDGTGSIGHADGDWKMTESPLKLGVYLNKNVSGSVGIVVCGFDGQDAVLSADSQAVPAMVKVAPGAASTHVHMTLMVPGTAPSVCFESDGGTAGRGGAGGSTGGMSGSGGGGAGGASGSGGSVGGTGGIGGSVGGAGGGAGTTGTGGRGGAGGVAGTGGRGGTTGTGGVAGTGGRGGAAGTGGTGGTAGTGATWRGALSLSTVVGNKTFPSVAVDAVGNAVVVYEQGTQVWSNRYDAVTGWGTPGLIDARVVGSKPEIAVDRNGNYLAVWGTDPNTAATRGIWYSTSSNGTEWSTTPMAFTNTVSYGPVLAMNANGMVIVAWTEQLSGGLHQVGAVVRPGIGASWTAAKVLRDADDNGPRNPAVAVTGGGVALVGWEQDDGLGNGYISLWMQQYTQGVGWNVAEPFETYTGHNAYGINIAANSGNQAIATYTQITNSNPPRTQVRARRFDQSFATNSLLVFEENSIDGYVPAGVTIDDAGNATVAFAVETSTGFQVQTSRTALTATSWPPAPTSMETDNIAKDDDPNSNIGYVTMPIVKSDPAGNVTLIWRKRTTASGKRFDLVARRYTPAGGWGAQQFALEDNTANSVFWPALAVGANGTVVATWYFGTSLEVWANVFH